jgi:DnaJ-class molecular chaperone
MAQPANPDQVPEGAPSSGESLCRKCSGKGEVDGRECPECDGTGKVNTPIGGA